MGAGPERSRTVKAPEERREDLFTAALRVFKDRGVGGATIADVTREAGVAKGTFYLYFDSKDHLLGALKERMIDEILQHSRALYALVGRQDWWALVDTFCESYVDFMLDHRDMVQVMAQEGITSDADPAFAECNRKVEQMLADGLRAGMAAGVFATSDPELTSSLLHHAVKGTLLNALLYEAEVDRQRLARGVRELVRKTLAP